VFSAELADIVRKQIIDKLIENHPFEVPKDTWRASDKSAFFSQRFAIFWAVVWIRANTTLLAESSEELGAELSLT